MKQLAAIVIFCLSSASSWAATPLKVAIVDTGLDLADPRFAGALCSAGNQDFTGEGLDDRIGHGTHVASLVMKYAGGPSNTWCMEIFKYYSDKAPGMINLRNELKAFKAAIKSGAVLVNFSGGGPDRNDEEFNTLQAAAGTTFIAAAGNNSGDASNYYPCAYATEIANVSCVGSLTRAGVIAPHSDIASWLFWEIGEMVEGYLPGNRNGQMSGTSMSTAIYTGRLLSIMLRK